MQHDDDFQALSCQMSKIMSFKWLWLSLIVDECNILHNMYDVADSDLPLSKVKQNGGKNNVNQNVTTNPGI